MPVHHTPDNRYYFDSVSWAVSGDKIELQIKTPHVLRLHDNEKAEQVPVQHGPFFFKRPGTERARAELSLSAFYQGEGGTGPFVFLTGGGN